MKEIKEGTWIKNECWNCSTRYMQIYDISRTENTSEIIVWCECPKCHFVDDIISLEEDIISDIVSEQEVKEKL